MPTYRGLAVSEEHRELAASARAMLADRNALGAARAATDGAPPEPPAFWKDVVDLGWLGLHIAEQDGGQGFGVPELAVLVEELGRVVAPGPFLPTALALALIAGRGAPDDKARLVPELLGGTVTAAVGLPGDLRWKAGESLVGSCLVPGGAGAQLLLVPVGAHLAVLRPGPAVIVEPTRGIDATRQAVRVTCAGVVPEALLRDGAPMAGILGRTLAAAEAAGGARACTEAAVAYAKEREQFGRPIGSFQAVKHMCANMLVATELATAAAWDAARAGAAGAEAQLAAAIAAEVALDAYVCCAELNIQVHGGIGFTWEHDAHLYLRRALSMRATAGSPAKAVARLALAGAHRPAAVDLPPEAESYRLQVRDFRTSWQQAAPDTRAELLTRSGYAFPHWPTPYGRDAGPVEQLVIEQELPEADRPQLGIGTWILPTLLRHGTSEQLDRWAWPSLDGDLRWCQLFSEPGAGSDAASITTRATRTDGGWLVTGQKVWTSDARAANRGLTTVRTNPDVPKHKGITMLVIDMTAPGVTVRPLREITGEAMFNEVFFDDVFVPDADVVGEVDAGWMVARATLANERISIGTGEVEFCPVTLAMDALRARGDADEPDSGLLRDLGHLVAEKQAMRLLGVRTAALAVAGADPGPEGSLAKLLSGEHQQRVADLLARIGGPELALDGDPKVQYAVLFTRGLTIAGGTSEIIRTQIAERVLGLPRS